MNRLLGTDWSAKDCHPTEDDLLYYVDGELEAKDAAKLRAHLEACWSCRVRTKEIEETIVSFVHFLNKSVASNIGPPPHGWQALDARMARLAGEAGARPLLLQWFDSLKRVSMGWPLPRSLALGALVILLVVSLVVRFDKVPPVSASQLIQKVSEANDQRLLSVVQPVIHQKLKVQRKATFYSHEGIATWEIWNDTDHNRFKQRIEEISGQRFVEGSAGGGLKEDSARTPAPNGSTATQEPLDHENGRTRRQPELAPPGLPMVVQELAQVLKSNRMDPRNPLSPFSYEAWRKSIQKSSEAVNETNLTGGDKALTLTTDAAGPFVVNAIIQAQFVVRREDWHPVEQRLKVQGDRGIQDYVLTENAFEVLPLSTVSAAIFVDPAPPSPSPKLSTSVPAPVVAQVLVPSLSELATSEVKALFALHTTKACLGGLITAARSNANRVEVGGVVDSADRREEILTALKGIPWVTAQLHTVEEVSNPLHSFSSGSSNDENEKDVSDSQQQVTLEVQSGKLPIQDLLEKYFAESHHPAGIEVHKGAGVGEKIAELSNKTVSGSEAALEEAWALRRLAELNLSLRADELPLQTRWVLETMIRDHMTNLSRHIDNSRQLLQPILSSLTVAREEAVGLTKREETFTSTVPESSHWTSGSLHLFATVEHIVRLSMSLFADTSFPMEQRDTALRELQSAFGQWESEFQILEAQVARTFPGKPDSLMLKNPTE